MKRPPRPTLLLDGLRQQQSNDLSDAFQSEILGGQAEMAS